MNKDLQSLSAEELLKALETASDEVAFRTDGVEGDVLKFFNEFNIKGGDVEVPKALIFHIYQAWSKKPVTAQKFAKVTGVVIPTVGIKYLIDEEAFKLKRSDWIWFYSNPTKAKPRGHSQKRHFDAFVKYFDLKPGENPVHFESLVLLYTRFLNEIKRKANMSKEVLESHFRLYFKEKNTNRGSYYCLSDSIWKSLNKEIYNEKEKKSKKLKKIPITHSGNES